MVTTRDRWVEDAVKEACLSLAYTGCQPSTRALPDADADATGIWSYLACSDVTMPALLTEMLCCSIASWIDVRSCSFIWKVKASQPGRNSRQAQSSQVKSSQKDEAVRQTARQPERREKNMLGSLFSLASLTLSRYRSACPRRIRTPPVDTCPVSTQRLQSTSPRKPVNFGKLDFHTGQTRGRL